ncbi:hypothetical protein [Puniceibacterium confluentis]|uniref:hypothetical protein n=1 Tax=Puniceibacterium confluentis TaxID=1958944 RepID=UPI0011B85B6B
MSNALWPIIRRLILMTLRRSAKRVLLTRDISENDQAPRRWLVQHVDRLISKVAAVADDLCPVANFDALPKAGNRLMVEMAIFTSAAYPVLLDDDVPADSARALVVDVGWEYYARLLRLTSLPFRLTSRDPGRRLR